MLFGEHFDKFPDRRVLLWEEDSFPAELYERAYRAKVGDLHSADLLLLIMILVS